MIEKFNIKYLQSFNKELNEILYYIGHKLKNKNAAKRLSIKIEKSILEASKNPKSFEIYKTAKKSKYNWYRIYVKNFIIYYTVKGYSMIVVHIVYKKRNIEKIL